MHFKYTEKGSYLLGKTAWYKKLPALFAIPGENIIEMHSKNSEMIWIKPGQHDHVFGHICQLLCIHIARNFRSD